MATRLTVVMLAGLLLSTNLSSQAPGPSVPGQPDPEQRARRVAELNAAIASRPAQAGAYVELSVLYRMDGQLDEAEALLRQGLQAVPRAESLYAALTALRSPVYEPEVVLEHAEAWEAAIPGSLRAITYQAVAHMELAKRHRRARSEALGRLDLARQAIERAAQIDASDRVVFSLQSQLLQLQADFERDPAERARLRAQAASIMQRLSALSPSPTQVTTVQGASPSNGVPSPPLGPTNAIRVGGNVRPPTKVKDVRPTYPPVALEARVQGVVIMEIVISETGRVIDARVMRSIPLLDQAAFDAVLQWEFEPTLLNGKPVPVIMTATVSFNLM